MRSLLLLIFGGVCGVIATVLLFTLDTSFGGDAKNNAGVGVGNARLQFDEGGLEALIRGDILQLEGFAEITLVDVQIHDTGTITIYLGVGTGNVAVRGALLLDPNIEDGRLSLDVLDASLGPLGVPGALAELIEQQLRNALDNLDPNLDYRLVAITTRNRQLTLEIELS